MQAGIGAVDDVDVAALVGLDIVGLDRDLAAVLAVDGDAALVGRRRDRRNEVADLPGMIGIANVERAHAGIEEGDERHLLVVDRRHAFVRGMRAEPPAALAEIAARLRHGVARDHHRAVLDGDVGEPHHLPRLGAFVEDRLVDDHHDVAGLAVLVLGEFGDRHVQHRKRRVRAVEAPTSASARSPEDADFPPSAPSAR